MVHVHGAGVRGGTGFFAAPGRVLTCAHVVAAKVPDTLGVIRTVDRVQVRWEGEDYEGLVEAVPNAHEGAGLWGYPDLAVITLPYLPRDHSWFSLTTAKPAPGAQLLAAGFSALYQRGTPQLGASTVECEGPAGFCDEEMLKVKAGELAPGMSGGPLLDLKSGRVVGLVTTTRKEGSDMGGLALPASVVSRRFHDVWDSNQWAARPPGDDLWALFGDLRHESAYRGLLSEAECRELATAADQLAVNPNALYWRAVGELGRAPDKPLENSTALVRECADAQPARVGAPHPLVRLAEIVAVEHARRAGGGYHTQASNHEPSTRRLRKLPGIIADRLGEPYAPCEEAFDGRTTGGTQCSAIEVRLTPSGSNRRRYLLSIWKHMDPPGCPVQAVCMDEAVTLAQARDHVRKELPLVLQQLKGQAEEIVVEFTLPRKLLTEAVVDEWDLGHKWAPLGTLFVVVLRALDRTPVTRGSWLHRWRHIETGAKADDPASVNWVDCRSSGDIGTLFASLQQANSLAVLGISYQPDNGTGRQALEAAIHAGIPAAVWPRATCPEHAPAGRARAVDACGVVSEEPAPACTGDRFQRAVERQMTGQPLSELPKLVKRLRIDARVRPQDSDHCGRALTLLWDDPTREVPDGGARALVAPSWP
ncbi:VMAP-related conflict system protein [Streptomyces sp. Tu 2975]|uniref:VMAP-related conflict system protein n=1 Tax=Streptomyces sp. Tu 2975 TaxID=2676871 RepID=UPI00244BBD3F|nr:VMAP-related conflict system protein [Streptomyces sp. Tu 2975]